MSILQYISDVILESSDTLECSSVNFESMRVAIFHIFPEFLGIFFNMQQNTRLDKSFHDILKICYRIKTIHFNLDTTFQLLLINLVTRNMTPFYTEKQNRTAASKLLCKCNFI